MNREEIIRTSMNLDEAAKFLGFKNKRSLQVKVKKGEIPGFKAGKQWMFYVPDIVDYIRSQYSNAGKTAQVSTEEKVCHLASQKIVPIGRRASQSAALEFKNQRDALIKETRKNMKISAKEK